MRIKFVAAILVTLLLVPSVTAHGADTFSFILRNSSIQPESAQVLQNDTLIFYNVVDYERNISLEGPYGEEVCTAGPSSPGIEDECRFWLDPEKYGPETYGIQIFSNGSWWGEVVVTIVLDNHTENLPPSGYNLSGGKQQTEDVGIDSRTLLMRGAVLSFAAAAIIWINRRVKEEEE